MANKDQSIAELKEVVAANPNDLEPARKLAAVMLRELPYTDSEAAIEAWLEEIRVLRRRFPSDERLALLHAMALYSAAGGLSPTT